MKKRVLSLLLLLAMLITMVPTMAVGASAETDNEELPRSESNVSEPISDYYTLYKTEGLVAFFDALDPANGSLDLANGKWYARVYNADTKKFEISDKLFATVKGGAYDAASNPDGWQAYASGFGYADPDYTAADNVIEFDKQALLSYQKGSLFARYSNWTVDMLLNVTLRDVADKDGTVENAFLFGPLGVTHWTNLKTGEKGAARYSITPKAGSSAAPIYVTAKGFAELQTSPSFITYNGKIAPLTVSKISADANGIAARYTVTHGTVVSESRSNAAKTDYVDEGLHILKNEQGTVYTVRVYASETGEALTAREATINTTVDNLIRLDVSLDVFNKLVEYDGLVEKFLAEIAPALDAAATKADYESAIEAFVAREAEVANAKKLDKYEKLYVGANGSLTENGGKLVSLFAVTDATLDLTTGEWINKIGTANASLGNADKWSKRADGTVGYTGLYGQMVAGSFDKDNASKATTNTIGSTMNYSYSSVHFNTRLNLGMELLPNEDFTIEYVAKYNPIYVANPDGTIATDDLGNPIEYYAMNGNQGLSGAQYTAPLDYIGLISSWTVCRDGVYSSQMPIRGDVIWMLTEGTPSWGYGTAWVGSKAFTGGGGLSASGIREYGKVHTYVYTRDENLILNDGNRTVEATYSILRDAAHYVTSPVLSTANRAEADLDGDGKIDTAGKENWGTVYYDNDTAGKFYLSSSIPTDFYKVRIYDKVLTARELAHNAFIDMASYAKADLSVYEGLEGETLALVEDAMLALGYTSDSAAFAANLADVIDLYANQVRAEDTLYVTDGLRVLTTAYDGLDTGALTSETVVSWFNAARQGEQVSLKGSGWERRSDDIGGGYYILKQYINMQTAANRQFGIYLTPEMLPEANFSVELVVNPTGIVDIAEDGTYTRYIDSKTTYGIHYENGFMIGPLRCLIFPAKADGASGRAGLEKRWCYDYANYCWNNTPKRNHKATENAWNYTSIDDVVTYAIDYTRLSEAGKGDYILYNDYEKIASIRISETEFITNERANNAFQMMVGNPGGVFSVRVYDKVLSEAEKIQNHAADIIYYYDLNTDLLDQVLPYFSEDPTVVFRGLAELSFDMPREEAQTIFDARLSALWLGFEDVAIRNDQTEGLRYYFTLDETTATAMINAGFKIEIGAIVNVGQNTMPSLDGRNYDFKVVAYDSIGGRNAGFFIDDDTFAVTVKAGSANKKAMLAQLNVLGYVRLTDAEGKDMYFYVETAGDGYQPDSFFSVYNHMMDNVDIAADTDLSNYLYVTAENCYEREYVYLKAGAPAGGNGTKDAPYNDFETAFLATKAKLPGINVPTYLYLHAAEGVYELSNLVTIDGSEIPYEHSRFVITSENGKGTLTSTKKLENSDFVKTEGNVYTYQFEPDANGEYPAFRYLYVDGKIADMSHNGANNFYSADETRYMTKFYRWDIGPWLNARYMWEAGTLTATTLYYPTSKVELNSQFAYYRDQYMVYQDIYYAGKKLTPASETAEKGVSSYYLSHYKETKFNKLAFDELRSLYYGDVIRENKTKMLDALKTYKSVHTEETVLAADKATYDAALAAFNAAKEQYQAGSAEYEAAVATHAAALKVYEEAVAHAKASIAEYAAVLDTIVKAIASAMGKGTSFENAINVYGLKNPTASYPTVTTYKTLDDATKNWIVTPSSGIYAQVKALHDNGTLTHESAPYAGDKNLAQELQFYYYRDALLAMDEINALTAETLNFTAAPKNANGSEQYKELFYEFLYKKIAVAELEKATFDTATKNAAGTAITAYNKGAMGAYVTKYTDAPAKYVEILTEFRNAQMLTNPAKFEDFDAYLPVINEASGPYAGKIPSPSPLEAHKSYFNVKLVGNQDFAIAQGRAKLEATAAKIKAEALGKFQAAYDAYVAAQTKYEELLKTDKAAASAYADVVTKARNDAKDAQTACNTQLEIASRYLSDETDEAFILDGAGMQLAMPTEWTYNFLSITGVDYDDKIVKDGETHIAIYFDPDWYPFSLNSEGHWVNRMASFLSSTAYLDKNNEFYYHEEAGKLYYFNTNGIDNLQFEYPTMSNMFYLTNIKNVIFENIAFTGLDYNILDAGFTGGQASSETHLDVLGVKSVMPSGAPILGRMVYGITVRGCNFHDLACEGVTLRGRIEDTVVEGNTFTNIGSGAIRFGDTAGFSLDQGSENCTITNNYLDGIALILFSSPALTVTYAKDLDVSYNTIRNTSYSGLSIGWNWSWGSSMYGEGAVKLMHVDLHHNYIESVMQQMGDGGHIYTLGGNAVKEEHHLFNWCHDNYLVYTNRTGDGQGRFHAANYHDGSSSNWDTYNTVVVAHSFGASGAANTSVGNAYKTPDENIDQAFFETVDTEFSLKEYQQRLRNNHNHCWAYYEQTLDSAQAFNITLHDNFLINVRSTKTTGTAQGTQFYEAFRTGVTAEDFIFVENMTYVANPAYLPVEAEDIIYEAGCEWEKGDPFDIADNNY